jgi:hypothetical protein
MENALIKHWFHVKKKTSLEAVWITVYDTLLFELIYAIKKGIISVSFGNTNNE